MMGATTLRYTSIWEDSGLNTLSKVNVFVVVLSPISILMCISPFFGEHATTLDDPAFLSTTFFGLEIEREEMGSCSGKVSL